MNYDSSPFDPNKAAPRTPKDQPNLFLILEFSILGLIPISGEHGAYCRLDQTKSDHSLLLFVCNEQNSGKLRDIIELKSCMASQQ